MPGDVPDDVPLDCTVYRVAKKVYVKPDGTPQSGCFADKAAEDGSSYYMSVYFSDEMAAVGKSVADLQKIWGEDYTVLEFGAGELLEQGERLWREPNNDFPGHGACKRSDYSERTRGQKRNLARIARVAAELAG